MHSNLETLINLLSTRGHAQYGCEAVSQLEHALQCATLAEFAGRSPELITACLLHDIGHLIHNLGEDVAERGVDDRHEYRALPYLEPLWSAAVTEPIRLHVEAKRYLCAADPTYWDTLSPASQISLKLQGGVFSAAAAETFICKPYAKDAVQLRLWDDCAKVPHQSTPDLDHFKSILIACAN